MATKVITDGLTSIEVYNLVLSNKIARFPRNFWKEISEKELRELLIYFFEEILHWTIEDIKNKVDSYIFSKYKLGGGMFQDIFEGSPFKVVNFTYPNCIKEWELRNTPLSYWTIDRCVEATKHILEKENWTDEDIKNKPIVELFNKYGITTVYVNIFEGNVYNLINTVFPNRFKPWELPYAPKNYWNIETGVEAIKWMLEEKLNWNDEDIKKNFKRDTFREFKLEAMLNKVFDYSPFKAINMTYPGRFTEKDFNQVPRDYWTMERAIKAIKNVLDELSYEEIKKHVSVRFFIENGLRYPVEKFFYNRPFLVLDTIYPNRFNKKDFDIRRE